jgi:hypothetical protein
VLQDEIGLQLVAPDEGWRNRPDMDPAGTQLFRAAIVARARFIEDHFAGRTDGLRPPNNAEELLVALT